MTDVYLEKTISGTVTAAGVALLSLAPDVGQYWKPILVLVNNNSEVPQQCFLFSGAPLSAANSVTPPPPSFLKDSTFQAQQDVSSILTGTIVHYGQSVTTYFVAGIPGDVVTMQIIGISSDTPPPVGILPSEPGIRFSGAFAGATTPANYVDQGTGLVLGAGATKTFPGPGQAFYVGGLNNVYVTLAVAAGAVQLQLLWFQDRFASAQLSQDVIDNNSTPGVTFDQSVSTKGPWMQVVVVGGPAGCTCEFIVSAAGDLPIVGNSGGETGNILLSNDTVTLAAGAHPNVVTVGPYAGPAYIIAQGKTGLATNWAMELFAVQLSGFLNPIWYKDQRGPLQAEHIYLPAAPIQLNITNNDAGNATYVIIIARDAFYSYA